MKERQWTERIARRLRRANLDIDAALAGQLAAYLRLLLRWNEKINLTALSDPEDLIDRLLLEPVVAASHWPAGAHRLLDVGSGGGSPAIPLALAVPGVELWMVESKTRKAAFLREAIRELALDRAHVEVGRYEELLSRPDLHESLHVVSLRAVRAETNVLGGLQAFLVPGGQLWWFRGPGGQDLPDLLTPFYRLEGSFVLVERLRSRLVVLQKHELPGWRTASMP